MATQNSHLVRYGVVPGIGRVRWSLYDEQMKAIYLRLEKSGEINRLADIEQLGGITAALDCAHHTRWEYLALTLYLVALAGAAGGKCGLSSNVAIAGRTISTLQVISVWMTLLQTGHLKDTFAAERYLAFHAQSRDIVRRNMIAPVPESLKEHCNSILQRGDWSRTYEVLAMRRLAKTFEDDDASLELACALLGEYANPSTEKIRNARTMLRALRQVAFAYLDSQFTDQNITLQPVGVALRLHEGSLDPGRLLDVRDPAGRLLQGVTQYLTDEVYQAPMTQPYVYATLSALSHRFGSGIASDSDEVVARALHDLIRHCRYAKLNAAPTHAYALCLPMRVDMSEIELFQEARAAIGKTPYRVVTAKTRNARVSELHVLARLDDKTPAYSRHKLYRAIRFADDSGGLAKLVDAPDLSSDDLVRYTHAAVSALDFALTTAIGASIRVEIRGASRIPLDFPVVVWRSGRVAARSYFNDVERLAEELDLPDLSEIRAVKSAFDSLVESITGGYFLCTFGSVYLRSMATEKYKEVDGILLHVSSSAVRVFLAEAKEGYSDTPVHANNRTKDKLVALGADLAGMAVQLHAPSQDCGIVEFSLP